VNYLKDAGLSISDVTTVEVDDPTRAAEAFISGTVDAAVTWEPYLTQIRSKSLGTVLADTRTRPGEIVDVLVASRAVVRDRPDVVRQVAQGWLKALDEVHNPRPDTSAMMARGLGMKEQDFRDAAGGVSFANLDRNRYWLGDTSEGTSRGESLFVRSAEIWRAENLSTAPLDAGPYFAPTFVLNSQAQ
jgi:NitT/TauT family transport system substrate-binding protein